MTSKNFTRRGFLGLSAAAVVGAGLTACTGATPGGSAGGGAASGSGAKTLRVFTYEDNNSVKLLRDLTKKFDEQNGMTTTVDTLPGSGAAVYPDKLKTELLGGKGPDIWRIWGGELGHPFVKAKQAADLTQYYSKFGWDSKINTQAISGMTFDG